MPPLDIFKLAAVGLSAAAAVYGMGRMLYVALTAPTAAYRVSHRLPNAKWYYQSASFPSPFNSESPKQEGPTLFGAQVRKDYSGVE